MVARMGHRRFLLLLLLQPLLLLLLLLLRVQGSDEQDIASLLLDFKASLEDPSISVLGNWNSSNGDGICSSNWAGVVCSEQGKVVGLRLDNTKLKVDLTSPAMLVLTTRLQSLSLAQNNLTWSSPEDFFSRPDCSLESINLSRNALQGQVPSTGLLSGSCNRLSDLDLSGNNLTGTLTVDTADSPPLRRINLSGNNLTAVSISSCSRLEELDISKNKVGGSIFTTPTTCPSLRVLNISANRFQGEGPLRGVSLPSLETFVGSFNDLSGNLSWITANFPSLGYLDLSSNSLTSLAGICSVPNKLKALLLAHNQLSSSSSTQPTMEAAMGCRDLEMLDLSFNRLQGQLPASLCSALPRLRHLLAWANALNGSLPAAAICSQCTELRTLVLNFNELQGNIPAELGECRQLEWLSLSSNKLLGPIPGSLGRLQSLGFLELRNNSLEGNIPDTIINNCTSLVWLDLSDNRLSGPLPSFVPRAGLSNRTFPNQTLGSSDIAFAMNTRRESCDSGSGLGGLLEVHGLSEETVVGYARQQCNGSGVIRLYSATTYGPLLKNATLESPLAIDLSGNRFSGGIPDDIGKLSHLSLLDLARNELNGSIPASLGSITTLTVLDLSRNRLSGNIPDSLCNLTFLSSLDLSDNRLVGLIPPKGQLLTFPPESYYGNAGLHGLPLSNDSSRRATAPASVAASGGRTAVARELQHACISLIATVVAGFLVMGILLLCWIQLRRRRAAVAAAAAAAARELDELDRDDKCSSSSVLLSGVVKQPPALARIAFEELLQATGGFSQESLVGSGGSCDVYKAALGDGVVVAVKKLRRHRAQGDREFVAEMETLGQVQHPNLVALLGYSKRGDEKLLVYEYLHGGSLEALLHDSGDAAVPWWRRAAISMAAARGLAFLHHACIPHIIHRDMKSSNVLLAAAEDAGAAAAKVSDFGMARLMSASDTHLSVTTLSGTPGYVPPEYYQSFRCTRNGDVYSYGVVLLELLSRKRPTGYKDEFVEHGNLAGWAKWCLARGSPLDVLDPELLLDAGSQDLDVMLEYLQLACCCVQDQPQKRPSMLQVVARFKELLFNS